MEKYSYDEWKRMSLELAMTKESIEEMSKLYMIAHARVKAVLRRVQTDLNYDPTDDCARELDFIKDILSKLANRQNDEYLSKMDPKTLDKYEQNYYGLMQLLRLALITESSKGKVNVQQLRRISQKNGMNDQFSLRGELKKSQQRMVRTKSGHRITRPTPPSANQPKRVSFEESNIPENDLMIGDVQSHTKTFLDKRKHLQETINGHITREGLTVNFEKKYPKLIDYLQERKQFTDLMFCDKFYEQMIQEGGSRKNQPKASEKKEPDVNKIFPEFNIKTKYMKKQVKDNILKVVYDVKAQLLKEYHLSNVAKMQECNDNGMVKLQKKRKSEPKARVTSDSESSQGAVFPQRFKSTNRTKDSFYRRSMKSLGHTTHSTMKRLSWEEPNSKQVREKLANRFAEGRMPVYEKAK